MHLIITDAWLAKAKPLHLNGTQLLVATVAILATVLATGVGLYHVVWSGQQQPGPWAATTDAGNSDRYVRDNLHALAQKVGELQAKVTQVEALSQRVSTLAGIPVKESSALAGKGGVLVPIEPLTVAGLEQVLNRLDQSAASRADYLTTVESSLFEQKIKQMMLPTQHPVVDAPLGSPFGWRMDPITGNSAQHTGLDFAAPSGTPILAAAGGVVVTQEWHPAYGNLVEIDHGNDLVSRYAHTSKVWVKKGDLVKMGQKIAEVGSTGRSTGPHLHFEVAVQGQLQDPMKFLEAGKNAALQTALADSGRRAKDLKSVPASGAAPPRR